MSESLATHVEYAKSGRSECVKCHRPISQGAVRIGKQFHAHHEGQRYYHLKCWAGGAKNPKKPADYIFGFEHMKPEDQIAINKHCGHANEGAVAADHHVAGVAQQSAAVSSLNSAAPVATPSSPSTTFGGGSNATFGSMPSSKASIFLSQPYVSNAPQPAFSNAGAFGGAPASSGARATANLPPLTASMRAQLMEAHSLSAAITTLQASYPQLQKLRVVPADAEAVCNGAFELFMFDRDADELLHTLSRVLISLH